MAPVISSQGTPEVAVQLRFFVTSVDCTRTVAPLGKDVVPAASENASVPSERIMSPERGRTCSVSGALAVRPVVSVAVTVKLKFPVAVGVPPSAPVRETVIPPGRLPSVTL